MTEPTQLDLGGRERPIVAPPAPESAPTTRVGLFDGTAFAGIRGQLALEAVCFPPSRCEQCGQRAAWLTPVVELRKWLCHTCFSAWCQL